MLQPSQVTCPVPHPAPKPTRITKESFGLVLVHVCVRNEIQRGAASPLRRGTTYARRPFPG